MAPPSGSHARSHAVLLAQRLLNLRDSASPLTLLLDTIAQKATPVVDEFITRAKVGCPPLSLPPHRSEVYSV